MCNYLYYWVTVKDSHSYWHLEHMERGGGTGMYIGRGGAGGPGHGEGSGWIGGEGQRGGQYSLTSV